MAEEIQIIITCPVNKVDEFILGYLTKRPIPLDNNGQPLFTIKKHIRNEIIKDAIRVYRHGKRQLAQETVQIDEEIII